MGSGAALRPLRLERGSHGLLTCSSFPEVRFAAPLTTTLWGSFTSTHRETYFDSDTAYTSAISRTTAGGAAAHTKVMNLALTWSPSAAFRCAVLPGFGAYDPLRKQRCEDCVL